MNSNFDNTFDPIEDDVCADDQLIGVTLGWPVPKVSGNVTTGWSDYDTSAMSATQVLHVRRSDLHAEFEQLTVMQSTAATQASVIAKMEQTISRQESLINVLVCESTMWRARISALEGKVAQLESESRHTHTVSAMEIQRRMDMDRMMERMHREEQDRRMAQMMQRMAEVEQSPYGGMQITCGPTQIAVSGSQIRLGTSDVTTLSARRDVAECESLIAAAQTGIRNSSTATQSLLDSVGAYTSTASVRSTYATMDSAAILEDIKRSLTAAMSSAVVTAVPKMTADWLNTAPTVTHRRLLG